MFDRKKVTDDNAKRIANDVLNDPLLIRTLLLYDDPGEWPEYCAHRRDNVYRIVYFFISLVEYLDRTVGASYKAFMEYSSQVYREMHGGDYDSHVNRCRTVESGKHDFLVRSALAHERSMPDVFFISMKLAHFEEDSYNAMLGYCAGLLPGKGPWSSLFKKLFRFSAR